MRSATLSSMANVPPLAENGAVRIKDELGKSGIPNFQLARPDADH
jgi:hypothetical protein